MGERTKQTERQQEAGLGTGVSVRWGGLGEPPEEVRFGVGQAEGYLGKECSRQREQQQQKP